MSVEGSLELSLRGHDKLYQAIYAQDVGGAQRAMLHHVQQFEANIREALHRQGEVL